MKYALAVFSLLLFVMVVTSQGQDNDAPTGRQGIWPGWDYARQQKQQLMLMVRKIFLLMFYSSLVLLVTGDDDDEEGRGLLQHDAYDAHDDCERQPELLQPVLLQSVPGTAAATEQLDASCDDVNDEQALLPKHKHLQLPQPQACVYSPCVS